MVEKTVKKEYPKFDAAVEVKWKGDEVERVVIKDQGFTGRFKPQTTVQRKHLDILKYLLDGNMPK